MNKMILTASFCITILLGELVNANNPASLEYFKQKLAELMVLYDSKGVGIPGPIGPDGPEGPSGVAPYTIGQQVFGGYVFWLDNSDPNALNQHGLIVSISDYSYVSTVWSNVSTATYGSNNWVGGGRINTDLAMAQMTAHNTPVSAVEACANYSVNASGTTSCSSTEPCYSDWYLPSIGELVLLAYANRSNQGAFGSFGSNYFSSTEYDGNRSFAWMLKNFTSNFATVLVKKSPATQPIGIRCIRRF